MIEILILHILYFLNYFQKSNLMKILFKGQMDIQLAVAQWYATGWSKKIDTYIFWLKLEIGILP